MRQLRPIPTVLLITAHADHADRLRDALMHSGVPCSIARSEDPVQALSVVANRRDGRSAPPTLVIIAAGGGLSAELDALRMLRASVVTRDLPIVIVAFDRDASGLEGDDLVAAYRCGANSVVRASNDSRAFAAGIAQIAHYWLRLNEPLPLRRNEVFT